MRIAAALILVMTIGLVRADACPPGPCNKYKRVPPTEAAVLSYKRAVRGVAPTRFDRAALAKFLSTSAWVPDGGQALTPNTIPARTVRFFRPDQPRRRDEPDRIVIIRQIEKRKGLTYVEVDGDFFTLSRCTDTRYTCLNFAGALPEVETKQKFATPP